jgi:hypothetical protein
MPDTPVNPREAFEELAHYASDVRRASYQTVTNAIQRYVARLDNDPLASIARAILPPVDFDAWYATARATIKSMVGSGQLNWPAGTEERVALQAELLRRIAGEQIPLVDFAYDFHYVANNFNSNIQQFITEDFEPFHRDFTRLAEREIEAAEQSVAPDAVVSGELGTAPSGAVLPEYISQARLTELKALRPTAFDLRKLIRLCEEIDLSFRNQCFLAVAALTRALLDHVPPIFGHNKFNEVANNYGGGGKSFKDLMQHLENSARRIGDAHLHLQIRNSESLPTSTQVNFSNDLDALLAEIIRILR